MATLNFKGKSAVWNHHFSVPYHTLQKDKNSSLSGTNENENLIVEGDNLLALKALLPKYQGMVKCIYIDPPYNTGNEGWVYNDNVNNPIIKDWIGKTVGKEGEDLTRHDKWLCMMTPRLKLLRELLSDDGIIFISIDDYEGHNLRNVLNEVFSEENFLAQLVWRGMHTVRNSSKDFNKNTEFIFVFAKNKDNLIKAGQPETYLRYPTDKNEDYPYYDKKRDDQYKLDPLSARNFYTPYTYTFKNKVIWSAPDGSYPRYAEDTLLEMESNNQIAFNGDEIFRVDGTQKKFSGKEPMAKRFLKDVQEGVPPSTLLLNELVGFSKDGTGELADLFGTKVFDQPKPSSLIKWLLRIERKVDDKNYIVLDSFAGSGTTAQAVLDLNKEDGGNRKFILIQIQEKIDKDKTAYKAGYKWVHEITRDRVKKVIARDKIDDGFTYYKLGPSIDGKKILEGKNLPSWDNFAKYVHYLATGNPIDEVKKPNTTWEIFSKTEPTGVYLIYKDNIDELKKLAITRDWLEIVKDKGNRKIVYAPACFLDKEILDEHNISFVQIPFNLFQRS